MNSLLKEQYPVCYDTEDELIMDAENNVVAILYWRNKELGNFIAEAINEKYEREKPNWGHVRKHIDD